MGRLKCCPFCGGKGVLIDIYSGMSYVQCGKCCACTRICIGENSVKDAEDAWNRRYEPPTPHGAIVPFGNARLKRGSLNVG